MTASGLMNPALLVTEHRLPGGSGPVYVCALPAPEPARALLVHFPEGWRRIQAGAYDVAEEFTVLRGELTESGVLYRPGDWSFRPAHAHRTGLTAPGGALVVALFDAPPRWLPGPGTPSPVGPRVHLPSTTLPGSDGLQLRPGTRLCAAPEPPHSTAVLLTEDGRDWYWRQAPAGERLAPVRTLIRIPSPQERRIPGIATPGYALLEGGPLELPRLYPLLPGVPPPERLHIPYYARTQHYEQIARQVCVDGLDRPVYRWAYSTAIAE